MEGQTTGNLGLKQFLEKNNLGSLYDTFKELELEFEELIDLEDDDLQDLCNESKIDKVSAKSLIKAVKDYKSGNKSKDTSSTSNYSTNTTSNSTDSKGMLNILTNHGKKLASINEDINKKLNTLGSNNKKTLEDIDTLFKKLEENINKERERLENELESITNTKLQYFKNKLKNIDNIDKEANEVCVDLEKAIKSNGDTNSIALEGNKLLIKDISYKLENPNLKISNNLNIDDYFNNNLNIDACNVPYTPELKVIASKGYYLRLSLGVNPKQPKYVEEASELELQWAPVASSSKDKKKKKKKNSSDSDDSDDSDDGSSDDDDDDDDDSDKDNDKNDDKDDEKNTENYETVPEKDISNFVDKLGGNYTKLKWKSKKFKLNDKEEMEDIDLKEYKIPMYKLKAKTKYIFVLKAKNITGWSRNNIFTVINTQTNIPKKGKICFGMEILLKHINRKNCLKSQKKYKYNGGTRQQEVCCIEVDDPKKPNEYCIWVVCPQYSKRKQEKKYLWKEIKYDTVLRMRHKKSGRYLSHQNGIQSPITRQGEVCCTKGKDKNTDFRIKVKRNCKDNKYWYKDDVMNFFHVNSGKTLHSHGSMLNTGSKCQEVTCYGSRDTNDDWQVFAIANV